MPSIFVDYVNPSDPDVVLPNVIQITLTPTSSGYAHNGKPVRAITFELDNATTATIVTTSSSGLPDPQKINAAFKPGDGEPSQVSWSSTSTSTAAVAIVPASTYSGSLAHAAGSVLVIVQP